MTDAIKAFKITHRHLQRYEVEVRYTLNILSHHVSRGFTTNVIKRINARLKLYFFGITTMVFEKYLKF